jgi:hypothetical protein
MVRCCCDAVGEQHRSLAEELDCALGELLAKRILDGDQLAERLQRRGDVAPAGVRHELLETWSPSWVRVC